MKKQDTLKELEEYFKNTPKDQIQKDWQEARRKSAKNSLKIKEFWAVNKLGQYTERYIEAEKFIMELPWYVKLLINNKITKFLKSRSKYNF